MPESFPHYTVARKLPDWVKRGRTQFYNRHGGPAEVAKDVLFQASTVTQTFHDMMQADSLFFGRLTPEVVWDWTTAYTDEFLDEMQGLGKDLIQVTWSCGFSVRSEAIELRILTDFTHRAHQRGIRICAYLSLTNLFWKDAFEHEPELEGVVVRDSAFAIKLPLAFSANNHLQPFINEVCKVLYSQDFLFPNPRWSNIPYLRYLAAGAAEAIVSGGSLINLERIDTYSILRLQ